MEAGWSSSGIWFLAALLAVLISCAQVIDRVKNIFKLAQGEYIRPEHIEGVYKMSPFITNIFVYGDSLQTYLVAVIVPNKEEIVKYTSTHGFKGDSRALLEKDMRKHAQKEGLRGYEQVRRFVLVDEDFTVENGLLTPSLKLKRHDAKIRFEQQIKEMYSAGEVSTAGTTAGLQSKL